MQNGALAHGSTVLFKFSKMYRKTKICRNKIIVYSFKRSKGAREKKEYREDNFRGGAAEMHCKPKETYQ